MRTKADHEEAYQDLCQLLNKYAGKMTPAEMMAVAANLLGKLMALQDQRTMTTAQALEIIKNNLELGNKQVVDQLMKGNGGSA